jgi:hypothetical protein
LLTKTNLSIPAWGVKIAGMRNVRSAIGNPTQGNVTASIEEIFGAISEEIFGAISLVWLRLTQLYQLTNMNF